MAKKFYIARYEMYEETSQKYFGSLETAKNYLINEVNDEDSMVRFSSYIDIVEMTLNDDDQYEGTSLGFIETSFKYTDDIVKAIEEIK